MTLTKIDDRGLKTPIDLLDNEKIRLGTGNDLEIFHTGTHSYIQNSVGNLFIGNNYNGDVGGDIRIQAKYGENSIAIFDDGGVELYYDNSKKLETTSTGATVTGHLNVTDISSDSASARIYLQSGNTADSSIYFGRANDSATAALRYEHTTDALQLWGYNNSLRAEINSAGNLRIPNDSGKITCGTGDDLQIYHDGTASFITNTTGGLNLNDTGGYFRVKSDDIKLEAANGEDFLECDANGAVSLYYDDTKKFETTSVGIRASGNYQANDGYHIYLGTGNDLDIYHDGSSSYVSDTGTGSLKITTNGTGVDIQKESSETIARFIADGAVELYHNNSKKFETTSTGVSITGNTLAVKPVKTIVNTNQDHTSGLRFIISLPNTSRMFKITGTFSFSGSGSGHIYADFGDWSDNHTANLEGASYQIREGGNSSLDDVGNSRYHKVTPSGFDCFNLEVQYEITLTTKAFANGNDTGTQEGGARPGAFGFIKYTHPSIGCALTTFTFQDIAASGTDRLNTFAWDIDGISGSVGSGEHTYVVEEYPLT